MVFKTEDGWVSRKEVAAKEEHWLKARSHLIEKLGTEAVNDDKLLAARADVLFKEMDENGNGQIDVHELKIALSHGGIKVTDKELGHMMKAVDTDGDGTISMPEFEELLKSEVAAYLSRRRSTDGGGMCVVM